MDCESEGDGTRTYTGSAKAQEDIGYRVRGGLTLVVESEAVSGDLEKSRDEWGDDQDGWWKPEETGLGADGPRWRGTRAERCSRIRSVSVRLKAAKGRRWQARPCGKMA